MSNVQTIVRLTESAKRKRELHDDDENELFRQLCNSMQKRLILNPETLRLMEVVDKVVEEPKCVKGIFHNLKDDEVRKLASVTKIWRDVAYETLRERNGNHTFTIMWTDKISDSLMMNFNFSTFFDPMWLRNMEVGSTQRHVETQDNEEMMGMVTDTKQGVVGIRPVNFILTYGTSNFCRFIEKLSETEAETMYPPNTTGLFVLSPSVVFTTPNNSLGLIQIADDQKTAMSSLMFPECSHFAVEPFLVCNGSIFDGGFKTKVRSPQLISSHRPKVVILYQFQSIQPTTDGALLSRVLQSLGVSQSHLGFPLVTGVYNFIDGEVLSLSDKMQKDEMETIFISGMLLNGDDRCKVRVITLNLLDAAGVNLMNTLKEIDQFYKIFNSQLTSQHALLFYHEMITKQNRGGKSNLFMDILNEIRKNCPKVRISGIGNMSTASSMVIQENLDIEFGVLNEKMANLIGEDADDSMVGTPEKYDVTFVLLAYETDPAS